MWWLKTLEREKQHELYLPVLITVSVHERKWLVKALSLASKSQDPSCDRPYVATLRAEDSGNFHHILTQVRKG